MTLLTQKKWETHITVKEGDVIGAGTVIAETQETASILHKSMVPPTITHGTVIHAAPDGAYTVLEPIVTIRLDDGTEKELALAQKWPIRVPRPTYKRFPASVPLLTGQRILDTLSLLPREALPQFPADSEQENHDTAPDRQVV